MKNGQAKNENKGNTILGEIFVKKCNFGINMSLESNY